MEIIEVVKEFTFDSAHYIPGHPGACKNIHGHTYRLQVGFRGPVNSKTGVVIDFADIKQVIQMLIVNKLDHAFLNKLDYATFPNDMPSAEKIVQWMAEVIQCASIPGSAELSLIRLYETPSSYAEWRAEPRSEKRPRHGK